MHELFKFGMDPNAILYTSATHGTWLLYQIWIKWMLSSLKQHTHTLCKTKCPQLIKFGTEPLAILQTWSMHCTLLLYQIWTTSQHSSLRYHNKHSNIMKKLSQLLESGTKPNYILYTSTAHDTWSWYQTEANMSGHHRRMFEDGQTDWWMDWQIDWWTGPIPIFPESSIVEQGIIK